MFTKLIDNSSKYTTQWDFSVPIKFIALSSHSHNRNGEYGVSDLLNVTELVVCLDIARTPDLLLQSKIGKAPESKN